MFTLTYTEDNIFGVSGTVVMGDTYMCGILVKDGVELVISHGYPSDMMTARPHASFGLGKVQDARAQFVEDIIFAIHQITKAKDPMAYAHTLCDKIVKATEPNTATYMDRVQLAAIDMIRGVNKH